MRQFICQLGTFAFGLSRLLAAEPDVDASQLPRVPPTPPEQALSTFKVKPGFRLELAAAEPLVVSPVAMSFDEDGRLYVVEMRDYSERRPERLGRIRRIEDLDGDGRFEKSTVFADGLPWPTAVTCWAGGIFVGATPDILWMKDTSGDGVADEQEVIFTGFASDYAPFETNKLNVQALMNSFQWSLDNRIHGATSFSGGKVKLVDTPFVRDWLKRANPNTEYGTRNTLDLRGRDFSFDPRTLEMRAESGGGQHGMTFDNQGRKFVCSNSDHIQQIVYEDRYVSRNPYFTMPSPRVSIATDGPAAEVFRLSPDEPWRVLRTQWRVAGLVSGPIEGGGRASGYFTGATGLTIYRGDAYGEAFVGDAFIGDAGGNLVHRKKLRPDGIVLRAERPADEQKVEFLASTDNWFRPVQFANGPDGCLYIADMYREVIEHPWSLPANLKKHLDLNSGNDRGRIYRIVPEKFRQPRRRPLRHLSTKALVPLLAHRNGWMRDAAARLLYERQDATAVTAVLALVHGQTEPALNPPAQAYARLHGFYALGGMGRLPEEELVRCLGTNSVEVFRGSDFMGMRETLRIHALKLSEWFLKNPSAPLVAALRAQAERARNRANPTAVELQLVFTLGQLGGPRKVELLRQLIAGFNHPQMLEDPEPTKQDLYWFGPAVANCLGENAASLLETMHATRWFNDLPNAQDGIIAAVARPVGAQNRSNEVAQIIRYARQADWHGRASILSSLQDGLQQRGASLTDYSARVDEIFRQALTNATANGLGLTLQARSRQSAVRLLGLAPYAETRSNLLWLIVHPTALKEYRSAALSALGQSGDERFGADVLAAWPQLTPALRAEALGRFLQRTAWAASLLRAIDARTVQPAELSIPQQAQLRTHRDASIREQAVKVFGRAASSERQSVVETFQPALSLKGGATNGLKIFQARCATCHKFGSEGHPLGPDLATVKSGGKEKLLVAILDPNREVAPNFLGYAIETKDGESLSGVLVSEGANSVTLRMAGGTESIIARANIASLQSQGRSLMPEGLEEGLKPQDMADLLEFIVSGP